MKNKIFKWLFLIVAIIISFNVALVYISAPQSNADEKNLSIEKEPEIDTTESEGLKNEVQNFKNGIEAVKYAQNKLEKRVDYSTSLNANIKTNVAIFNFDIQLKAKTVIDENGVVYTLDAVNMYKEMFNGQRGFAYYSKKGNNNVFYRYTYEVTYDTCVPIFRGDYIKSTQVDACNQFGYIDNSKAIIISEDKVVKEEKFEKTDYGYEVSLRIKKDKVSEIRQKLYRCAELVRKPTISSIVITYTMDIYGNMTGTHYSIGCHGVKSLEGFGELETDLNIEMDQDYSYTHQDLLVPTAFDF